MTLKRQRPTNHLLGVLTGLFLVSISSSIALAGKPKPPPPPPPPPCVEPNLDYVADFEDVTMCNGSVQPGRLDLSNLYPQNIKSGVSIGGVVGTLQGSSGYPIQICKNGIGYVSSGVIYNDGELFGNSSLNDIQNFLNPFYTGAGRSNCNETNFSNATGGAGLVPDDSLRIAAGGSRAWNRINQDSLTGLYFTNLLAPDSTSGKSFGQALSLCAGLNGSSAGNGWRLPTQKELMQLYIDGASRLVSELGLDSGDPLYEEERYWSSTTASMSPSSAYQITLGLGHSVTSTKSNARAVICVRE